MNMTVGNVCPMRGYVSCFKDDSFFFAELMPRVNVRPAYMNMTNQYARETNIKPILKLIENLHKTLLDRAVFVLNCLVVCFVFVEIMARSRIRHQHELNSGALSPCKLENPWFRGDMELTGRMRIIPLATFRSDEIKRIT